MIVVWEGQSHRTFYKPSTVPHQVGQLEVAEVILLYNQSALMCFQIRLTFIFALKTFGCRNFPDIFLWLNANEERSSPVPHPLPVGGR